MYSENKLRKLAKTLVKKEEFLSQNRELAPLQTTNFERQFGFQCRFAVSKKEKVEIIMRMILIMMMIMMMMIVIITHQKPMLKLVIICKG